MLSWETCSLASRAVALEPASALRVGVASSGLRGLEHVGLLVVPHRELQLSSSLGYGVIESMGAADGAHHSLRSRLGVAVTPLTWLSFALRFDGRFDFHPDDGMGADTTGIGDPRVFVRAGHQVSSELQLGGELGLWLPGRDAPSWVPGASSVDLKGLAAWLPSDSAWSGFAALGIRIDNSARSAPDLQRLRPGDRISLGLSDSHAVLVALGATYRARETTELLGELSGDMLVGASAPTLGRSPMRMSLGLREALNRQWQVEVMATAGLSRRPAIGPDDPLVPVEPRFLWMVGVRYGWDEQPPRVDSPREPPPPPPQASRLEGVLVDPQGEPLPEVQVRLATSTGERETITDAHGRYRFDAVVFGPATLEVSAVGFADERWEIEVRSGVSLQAPRTMQPRGISGMLQGLTRSFFSEAIAAHIEVHDALGQPLLTSRSDADGRFEIELPPGHYRIRISAFGYNTHERDVQIRADGVTILNVDLRPKK